MTLRHLKIFLAVYHERNMTAVSNKLFMSQSAVSQTIKDLEDHYETVLFERLSRKLYVTAAGEKLYQYAVHIIELFDKMENMIKETSLEKNLLIGANYTVGVVLIHKYVEKFKSLYPGSEIKVKVNKASVLIDMLNKNELDLALIEEVPNEPQLVKDVFFNDRITIIAHNDHPLFAKKEITPHDIVNERLLMREKGSGARDLFEIKMNKIGLFIEPYWESTSTTALINAAKIKAGIAILPFQLVKEHIASGSVKEIRLTDMDLSRKLNIVYHKNKFLTDSIKDFIEVCHEPENKKSLQI